MASKLLLLFIALAFAFAKPAFGRGGGGRGGGGRGGGGHSSSGGHGWGGGGGGRHTYPSSGTGLSGGSRGGYGGGTHTYPSSGTGLSGGTRGGYGGGSHTYPSSGTGLSGGSRGGYGYGTGSGNRYGGSSNPYQTYQTGSGYHPSARYTPTYYHAPERVYVTEYRSSGSRYSDLLTGLAIYNLGRSHSHDHYYYHDTYSRSRYSDTYRDMPVKAEDEATCTLRVEEPGKVSHLKIPCEIVSTFAAKNETAASAGTAAVTTASTVDPLLERGPPVSVTSQMSCAVEVRTQLLLTTKQVDCGELVRLSKAKEPEPEKTIVPARSTYKSWLDNPPWWLSIFFVV